MGREAPDAPACLPACLPRVGCSVAARRRTAACAWPRVSPGPSRHVRILPRAGAGVILIYRPASAEIKSQGSRGKFSPKKKLRRDAEGGRGDCPVHPGPRAGASSALPASNPAVGRQWALGAMCVHLCAVRVGGR